jgi:hypothetical protein
MCRGWLHCNWIWTCMLLAHSLLHAKQVEHEGHCELKSQSNNTGALNPHAWKRKLAETAPAGSAIID